jgi:RNA polymerase sigma-70 factor (ECF subfamily)
MATPDSNKRLLESLHQQYFPMVMQMCLGYMKGDAELAKDMAQDVFINIWKALDGFKQQSSYKTWIYRITVNTCLLHIRKNKNTQREDITDSLRHLPDESGEQKESQHNALYRAIGELPELDRLIIMLMLEELEYDEIATITGISAVNLRVKIHRIKKKIRELFNNG